MLSNSEISSFFSSSAFHLSKSRYLIALTSFFRCDKEDFTVAIRQVIVEVKNIMKATNLSRVAALKALYSSEHWSNDDNTSDENSSSDDGDSDGSTDIVAKFPMEAS